MKTHQLLLWSLGILLILCQSCSKFDWNTTEHYDIQPTRHLELSHSTDIVPRSLREKTPEHPQTMKALPSALNMPQESTQEAQSNEGSQLSEEIPSAAVAIQEQNTQPNEDTHDDKEQASATDNKETLIESASQNTPACIDLNHADLPTLMRLPGVGERRASDIMARRTKHPFRHKRDITRIKGIGPKTYARMKDLLCDP